MDQLQCEDKFFLAAKYGLFVFDVSSFEGGWMEGRPSNCQRCELLVIVGATQSDF